MKNQRWILLVLIGGLLLPLFSYASDKPQIIESSYLNNNYVYWNSDWSTSYKNEKHQINLDKALSLFEKIRENINCKETDHNVYEKYFCVLVMTNQFHNYDTRQESKSLGEQYMGLMQDKPLTFMASLMTVSSILVGDIALRFNYTNALENYFIHYYYLTPYDRAILSDKNKLFAYMKALFQKEGTPYSMGDQLTVDGYAFKRSASLENFINNLGQRQTIFDKGQKGFQFGILNGENGPRIKITHHLDKSSKIIELTVEEFHQMVHELSSQTRLTWSSYLDGVFEYKSAYFIPSQIETTRNAVESHRRKIADLAAWSDPEMGVDWSHSKKHADRMSANYFKWKTSWKFRAEQYAKRTGVILAIGSFITYCAYQQETPNSSVDLSSIDDLPTLKAYLLNENPVMTALLAMTFDEIPQAIKDSGTK